MSARSPLPLALVVFASSLVVVITGCGGGNTSTTPNVPEAPSSVGSVATLAVRPVAWNAARARVGKVRAVADAGDVSAVFADDGAHVFTSGALVATDTSVTDWVDGDTILGPDGSARWIIGVNARGRIYHLRGRSSFEEVSERFGLGAHKVRGAAVLGSGFVGFLLDRGEIALADGEHVTRYGIPPLFEITGGGGFGAGVARDQLFVFTALHRAARTYALPNATHAVLGPDGRLYATTPRGVYATDTHGNLILVYEASSNTIHGLVASAEHIWFADGGELGVVDGARVALTSGAKIATDAKLESSTTGDVWVLANGGLSRFSRVDPEPELAQAWKEKLSGVFARSCAACHLPSGPSGVDLSNAEAWHSRRALIHDRIVVARTMPPPGSGSAISDQDREAVRAWFASSASTPPAAH